MNKTGETARKVEFYFDFISPFGFFASLRVDELAARYAFTVEWSSMLIGISVLKVMGLKSIPDTPLKGTYARHDAERYCRRHGITLGRTLGDPPANPLAAGRSFHWLKRHAPAYAKPVAKALLAAYWRDGQDIGNVQTVLDIASEQGADRAVLARGLDSGEAADLLREAVDASLTKGVFGSPFFIVDGEPFFGVEKMELMEEWMASGGW